MFSRFVLCDESNVQCTCTCSYVTVLIYLFISGTSVSGSLNAWSLQIGIMIPI